MNLTRLIIKRSKNNRRHDTVPQIVMPWKFQSEWHDSSQQKLENQHQFAIRFQATLRRNRFVLNAQVVLLNFPSTIPDAISPTHSARRMFPCATTIPPQKITPAASIRLNLKCSAVPRKSFNQFRSHRHIRRFIRILANDFNFHPPNLRPKQQRRGKLRTFLDAHAAFFSVGDDVRRSLTLTFSLRLVTSSPTAKNCHRQFVVSFSDSTR